MSIVYAKHFPSFVWETDVPSEFEASLGDGRILFFDPVCERFANPKVAQRLRTLDPRYRDADALVVRGRGVAFLDNLRQETSAVREIAPAVQAIYGLVGGKPDGIELCRIEPQAEADTALLARVLRQVEIEGTIARANALFSDQKGHYLHPSGAHADGFLRMADTLHDSVEVLRLSDWLLPYVSDDAVFIGDNGSLLALFATLQAEAKTLGKQDVVFRTLTNYPESARDIEFVLDDVLSRQPDARIIFVISVNSSGRLFEQIRTVMPVNGRFVVIVDTSGRPSSKGVDILATLPIKIFDVGTDGKCAGCSEGALIGIDPRTYERIPYFEIEYLKIDRHLATRDRDFWTAADETDAVRIHYDIVSNEGLVRHHAIYLDIERLLHNAWFKKVSLAALSQGSKPDLMVLPDHPVTDAVLGLAYELWGNIRSVRVAKGRFSQEVFEAIREIPDSASVLIADDGLVEGTTLRGLKHEYYRVVQQLGRPGPKLEAFVCLARPETESVLASTSRPYRDIKGIHLRYGHKILLPGSGDSKCPWCREEHILSHYSPKVSQAQRELIGRRLTVLASRDITPPVYDTEGLAAGLKTSGSFFGDLRKNAGFAATSSSAMIIREQLNAQSRFHKAAMLDVPMALSCYFDSPLLAGILRTLERKHLFAVGSEYVISDELLRFPTEKAYPGLIGELGWAAIDGKLPKEPVRRLLNAIPETDDVRLLKVLLNIDGK